MVKAFDQGFGLEVTKLD